MKIQRQCASVQLDPNIRRSLMFRFTVLPVTCLNGAPCFKFYGWLNGPPPQVTTVSLKTKYLPDFTFVLSTACHYIGCDTTDNFFFMARPSIAGQGLLIIEASRSHSDTSHSVRLLWTSKTDNTGVYFQKTLIIMTIVNEKSLSLTFC